ncbi:amino acid ABC transporter permease [Vineibacter terrae]|uniref:amino acid ABC transporter permease n=1 Tax=Vineibacter terrae TaxID=2586908 RepID=UPI002E35380A|nr:amino acid ABC transporter permease [Vineibacter terrae]HEX2886201.1 amino acid ABC transporter permease [Vineibacter terrae]
MSDVAALFFNAEIMAKTAGFLLDGLWMTVLLCLVVIPVGALGGLAVAVLAALKRRWLNIALVVYVDVFRALPPLVLLVFVYNVPPFAGYKISEFEAVVIAFLLNTSSYYGEIFRAGIESVGRGQWEAARSTGLGWWQTMGWVVLPQAVRNVLPDLVSNTLEVAKLTSIASVIALHELMFAARSAQQATFNYSPLILATVIYFVLLWPVVRLLSRLEHRKIAAR